MPLVDDLGVDVNINTCISRLTDMIYSAGFKINGKVTKSSTQTKLVV